MLWGKGTSCQAAASRVRASGLCMSRMGKGVVAIGFTNTSAAPRVSPPLVQHFRFGHRGSGLREWVWERCVPDA